MSKISMSYPLMDVLKLVFAILVVTIHLKALLNLNFPVIFNWVLSLAVPFFFVSSGFLLASKTRSMSESESESTCIHRCRQIFKLFFIWLLIYLPFDFIEAVRLNELNMSYATRYIVHLFLFGEGTFSWPLWFLYTLGITLLIVAMAPKNKTYLLSLFSIATFVVLYSSFTERCSLWQPSVLIKESIINRGIFSLGGGDNWLSICVLCYTYKDWS